MEEIIQPQMESEVISRFGDSLVDKRLGQIQKAAMSVQGDNPSSENAAIETNVIKNGVSKAVKDLEKGTQETFKPKEDTATIEKIQSADKTGETIDEPSINDKKILGMKSTNFWLLFGVVTVGTAVGIYLYKKKKSG